MNLDDDPASVAQPQPVDAAHTRMEELGALDRSTERAPAELVEPGGDPAWRGVFEDRAHDVGHEAPVVQVFGDEGGGLRYRSFGVRANVH